MMRRTTQILREHIPAAPEVVRRFYVDLDNITALHPLVVSVRSTGRQDTADGYVQTYVVHDRVPFGPVALPIRYTARLTVPDVGDVIADSRQFPRVRLHTVVSFEPDGPGTLLTERIDVAAPRPLAGVTVREGVAAHRQMLAGIAAHFS